MHYIHRMQHYRAYLLDEDGRITEAAELEASDDAAAWQLARRAFAPAAAVELWSGKRCVAPGARLTGLCPTNPKFTFL